jgi:uncharacterized protein YkvS
MRKIKRIKLKTKEITIQSHVGQILEREDGLKQIIHKMKNVMEKVKG